MYIILYGINKNPEIFIYILFKTMKPKTYCSIFIGKFISNYDRLRWSVMCQHTILIC